MIVKVQNRSKEGVSSWYYWDNVEEIQTEECIFKDESEQIESAFQILDSNKIPICCTRSFFSEKFKLKDGCYLKLIRLHLGKPDAEVIVVTPDNKVFILNDEGKTIDRI